MSVDDFTDAELCRRVLNGDTALFAALVKRHQTCVFRVAAAMLRDPAGADEVVQQAFVNAYEHLDQYRPELPFAQWVKAIARNLVRKRALGADREVRRLAAYRDLVMAATPEDADGEAALADVDAALKLCREQLAPAAARAISLRYEQGQSVEEIAAALGRGVGATRQLMFRVRLALRDCLTSKLHAPCT